MDTHQLLLPRAHTFEEETTAWMVILSRSEGSLNVGDRSARIGSRTLETSSTINSSRPGDLSLRLRMTGVNGAVPIHAMRLGGNGDMRSLIQIEKETTPC